MRGLGQLVVAWPVFTESVPVQQKWVRLPSAMSIQTFTRTHHFGKVEIKSVGEQPLKRRDVTGFSSAPQTPPAINVITPSAQLCWCVGVGSSAGGRVAQLTWTSWLLCTPSTGREDSPRSSLLRHLLTWEPTEDDMKMCSLPPHDGESPDYTRVPVSLLGCIQLTLVLIWERPWVCPVSQLQLKGFAASEPGSTTGMWLCVSSTDREGNPAPGSRGANEVLVVSGRAWGLHPSL